MNFFKTSFILLTASFALYSCGGGDPRADDDLSDLMDEFDESFEEEEKVDLSPVDVSWEKLISDELVDHQNVIFDAYIGKLPTTMYNYDNREMTIEFYPRRNQVQGEKMRVDITIGTSPGHVRSLPEEYAQEDLKIVCEGGKTAGVGSFVKVRGVFTNSTADYYNYLDLTKITLLEDGFDEAIFDKAVELTNLVIEDTTLDDSYSYMDVSMETSMYMSPWDGRYSVNISQKNNSYLKSAYITIGSKPGGMNQLTDGFTDKDFIVHDYNGEDQKAASGKYRIFGTFNPLDVEAKGTFSVEEIKKL
ncbi:MAG: hypothetical protein BM555_05335 [Crocinitomix sp. MedPE-SWsnd]|nr:MAG: hypothetical protein BM555_05335 [Crocinitomix sp. MedPE-SWsnd]